MEVLVVGCGLTGRAIAGTLAASNISVLGFDVDPRKAAAMVATSSNISLVERLEDASPNLVVLATPSWTHVALAKKFLEQRCHVISLTDNPDEVEDLFELDKLSHQRDRSLVLAGLDPGLSCMLAALGVSKLDEAHSIVVSKAGTAGPACARSHHRALKGKCLNWYDGQWESSQSGTGRLLHWFPEPIGPRDCYRGSLAAPKLLNKAFPDVRRISARIAANRRDRLTSRLPMLRPPHKDGGPAAVRVEISGLLDSQVTNIVYGTAGSPSWITAQVVGSVAGQISQNLNPIGFSGLAQWPQYKDILRQILDSGVNLEQF